MTKAEERRGRITRALKYYEVQRKVNQNKGGSATYKGEFFADDIEELLTVNPPKPGASCMLLFTALQAGWAMGYRCAKRERTDAALAEICHAATSQLLAPAESATLEDRAADALRGLDSARRVDI